MFSKKFLHHLSSYVLFGPLVFFFELFLRQVFKLLRKGCGQGFRLTLTDVPIM